MKIIGKQISILIGVLCILTIFLGVINFGADFSGPFGEVKKLALAGVEREGLKINEKVLPNGVHLIIAYHPGLDQVALIETDGVQTLCLVIDPCNNKYSMGLFVRGQQVGGKELTEQEAQEQTLVFLDLFMGLPKI